MSGQLRGNIMAGYFGYSMSNNAVEAYENGNWWHYNENCEWW